MWMTKMHQSLWWLVGALTLAGAGLPTTRTAQAQEVWRCGNAYRASPCAGGSTVDLTPPLQSHNPEGATPTHGSSRPTASRERTRSRSSASPPAPTRNAQPGSPRKAQCQELEERVQRLDAQGRRGGTSALMERLRHERQQARDQQFRLGCR